MSIRQDVAAIRRHPHAVPVAWGLAVFTLAIVARSLWVAYLNIEPGHDSATYWYAANTFAEGDGLRDFFNNQVIDRIAPGWPLALGTIIFIFGPHLLAAKALNIVLGSISAVLVYVLGVRLRDRRTGVVAGCLMAVFPSQVFFTTTLMTETLYVTLSTTLVLLLVLWLGKGQDLTAWRALSLGLLLGIMSLVRAESVLLAPAVIVLLKVCGTSWFKLAQFAMLLVAGIALLITPWTVRNYVRFDEVILIRKANDNGTLAPIRAGLDPNFNDSSHLGYVPPTFSASWTFYRDDPIEIPEQVLRKLGRFYGRDDHFRYFVEIDFVNRQTTPALSPNEQFRWATLGNSFYYVVAAAALVGIGVSLIKRNRGLLIVLWFTSSWSLIFLASLPGTRYHFAIMPMVALFGAAGFIEAWDWLSKRMNLGQRDIASRIPAP